MPLYVYMNRTKLNGKKTSEFEHEERGLCGSMWREEKKGQMM